MLQCDKSRLAVQMFTNLSTSGPALSLYPASQRVTFLYYLGRFNFDHGHYLRAHMCFEEAYLQCPPRFQKHRRQILLWWIPTNLLLGRFPSQALLQRPEAAGFAQIFLPICHAVRTGNFVAFHQTLAQNRDWLWDRGFYLTLLYRLKPLIWRSLTRKTFMLTWQGSAAGDPNTTTTTTGNKAASLALEDVVTVACYVQKLLEGYVPVRKPKLAASVSPAFMQTGGNPTSTFALDGSGEPTLVPPPGGPRQLMPSEGLIFGNKKPDLESIEAVVSGLVYAGLLNGFIARHQKRFAVEGTKKKGGNAVAAGWPNPYESILERFREAHQEALDACDEGSGEPPGELDDVPGWVRSPT